MISPDCSTSAHCKGQRTKANRHAYSAQRDECGADSLQQSKAECCETQGART